MNNKQNEKRRYRILWLVAFSVFIISIVGFRIYELGIKKEAYGVDLEAYGKSSEALGETIELDRGTIYDRKGQVVAVDSSTYSLCAIVSEDDPQAVSDPDKTAKILAEYIPMSRDDILNLLLTKDVYQVEFGQAGKGLSPQVAKEIEMLNLKGIVLQQDTQRFYPNDYFSSHLVGYATPEVLTDEAGFYSSTKLVGQMGVEKAYDDILSGEKALEDKGSEAVSSGEDIYLTIDSRIQNYLESDLDQKFKTYNPKSLGVYVVDLDDGGLLAASQRPSFNLNTREGIEDEWTNLLLEAAYEPGSTSKILIMAIAYDNHLYDPNEITQTGQVQIYDQVVKDYNLYGWGPITFEEGLLKSSNTTMVELARRMGDEEFIEALGKFGFGKTTGSKLPNELSGDFTFDNPVSRLTASFGQGFTATPLQLMQAYSSIANDGKMLRITPVKQIGDKVLEKEEVASPVSKEAANNVMNILGGSVNQPDGLAAPFKHPDVNVAAKTGTAEIADGTGSGYLTGATDYYFSVITYFPAEDPKYMIYLFMEQPKATNGLNASQILGEIFRPLVDTILISR